MLYYTITILYYISTAILYSLGLIAHIAVLSPRAAMWAMSTQDVQYSNNIYI